MKMDSHILVYMLIGVMGGVCVSMEGSLNALLGKHVGVLRAVIAPFAVGLLTIVIAVMIAGSEKWGGTGSWSSAPWYSYLGGVAAVVFVGSIIYVAPKMGLAAAFSAVLVGQFMASLILDATGLFAQVKIPITASRVIGFVLVIVGMNLFFSRTGS